MTKTLTLASALAAAAMFATPAAAQDANPNENTRFYAGATAGYHHIDEIDFNDVGLDAETDIDGIVYGGFAGVQLPTEGNLIFAVEGNYLMGSDAIDKEYGVSGLIGTRYGVNNTVYARAGYQVVDLDVEDIAIEAADDLGLTGTQRGLFIAGVLDGIDNDDKGEGFLLGVGTDVGIGDNAFLRLNADTIEFDTVRLTAGAGFKF